jgi:hypothetical protein
MTGDAVPQGHSGDGTSLRFMIRRGSWVVRLLGERSLSLGTPGLHDASPLGLNGYTRMKMARLLSIPPILPLRQEQRERPYPAP